MATGRRKVRASLAGIEERNRCIEKLEVVAMPGVRCLRSHEHDGRYHRWEGITPAQDDLDGQAVEVVIEWRIR